MLGGVVSVPPDFSRLKAASQTPADELCRCPGSPPIMLLSTAGMGSNPIHCLRCNNEVAPETLGLDQAAVDAAADWRWTYGSVDALELASGPYEAWAQAELSDPESAANRSAYATRAELERFRRCYFRYWQRADDADTCPICGDRLVAVSDAWPAKSVCERDSIVLYTGW